MKKITNKDMKELAEHGNKLDAKRDEMNALIAKHNEDMKVLEEEYEALREEALDDITRPAEVARGWYEERSDAWKEKPKGEAYLAWVEKLEGLQGEAESGLDITEVDEIEAPDFIEVLQQGEFQEPEQVDD